MDDAKITTSVDVKLGHADMINMLVEEQKEKLEIELATQRAAFAKLEGEEESLKKKIEEAVIKDLKLDQRKEIKQLIKISETLGLTVKTDANVNWKNAEEPFRTDIHANFNKISEMKSGMTKYKEAVAMRQSGGSPDRYNDNYRGVKYHYAEVASVETGFSASNEVVVHDKYGPNTVKDISLSKRGDVIPGSSIKYSAATKKMFKSLNTLAETAADKHQEIYELESQLFELENAGQRHKAKFLKAMLKNSDTGQQLLGIMKQVGGMNLLESGQDSPEE